MFDDLNKDDKKNDQKITNGMNKKWVPAPMIPGNIAAVPEKEAPLENKKPRPAPPPADIFAETENTKTGRTEEKPAIFKPKEEEQINRDSIGSNKKTAKRFIILVVILFILGLVGAGGYYAYGYFSSRIMADDNYEIINTNDEADREILYEEKSSPDNKPPTSIPEETENLREEPIIESDSPVNNIDSDNDGLSDDEEIKLGTDPFKIDSDNDGLFDREEVKVYNTDPMSADSDGDGYSDAEEIKAGYNPNGEGKRP